VRISPGGTDRFARNASMTPLIASAAGGPQLIVRGSAWVLAVIRLSPVSSKTTVGSIALLACSRRAPRFTAGLAQPWWALMQRRGAEKWPREAVITVDSGWSHGRHGMG
jgi:hypothetical protein